MLYRHREGRVFVSSTTWVIIRLTDGEVHFLHLMVEGRQHKRSCLYSPISLSGYHCTILLPREDVILFERQIEQSRESLNNAAYILGRSLQEVMQIPRR